MSDVSVWDELVVDAGLRPRERRERFRWLTKCEVLFGLTATFFLGFAPAVVLVFTTVFALFLGEWRLLAQVVVPAVIATGTAVWVARSAGRAGAVCYPEMGFGPVVLLPRGSVDVRPPAFAVELGLQVKGLPGMLRPLLSLWWCAHFAAGFGVVTAAHHWIADAFDQPGTVALVLFPLLAHLAFNVAANLYLILSVAALYPDESLLHHIWRLRFVIDVVVTMSALALLH